MKRTTDGKRYSRRERVEIEDEADLAAYAQEHGEERQRSDGRTEYVIPGGWRHDVERATQAGAAYLKAQGLPSTAILWKDADGQWTEDKPDDCWGRREIENHVRKLGHERDSLPDLAARLLTHAHRVESDRAAGQTDAALKEAVALGHALALARVYGIVSEGQRIIAAQPRRPDIAQIIQRLAALPGDSGELWLALRDDLEREGMDPEELATPAGDLQYQYHDKHDRPQTISKRRFATRLSEARKHK